MCLLFETIKIKDGKIANIHRHEERLRKTIEAVFAQKSTIRLSDYIKPPGEKGVYRCKVIYDTQIKSVEYHPYVARAVSSFTLFHCNFDYGYKYLNRSGIDNCMAARGDSDDIIFYDDRGYITDTSIANIAVKFNGVWYTPSKPLLQGTLRGSLLDSGFLSARDIKAPELYRAESFAVMNAMIGFHIVESASFVF